MGSSDQPRRRAVALVRAQETHLRRAWDARAALTNGCPDPVLCLLAPGAGGAAPEVTVRPASELAGEVEGLAPGLASHLRHLDTSVPNVLVHLGDSVVMIGDGRPCEACRHSRN